MTQQAPIELFSTGYRYCILRARTAVIDEPTAHQPGSRTSAAFVLSISCFRYVGPSHDDNPVNSAPLVWGNHASARVAAEIVDERHHGDSSGCIVMRDRHSRSLVPLLAFYSFKNFPKLQRTRGRHTMSRARAEPGPGRPAVA